MEQKLTPQQALDAIAKVIMKRVQGTGEEHSALNMALNVLHELVKKEENK
jgi:hypothetical protein